MEGFKGEKKSQLDSSWILRKQSLDFQIVALGSAGSASPENVLEMQIPVAHHRPAVLEILQMGPRVLDDSSLSKERPKSPAGVSLDSFSLKGSWMGVGGGVSKCPAFYQEIFITALCSAEVSKGRVPSRHQHLPRLIYCASRLDWTGLLSLTLSLVQHGDRLQPHVSLLFPQPLAH